MLASCRWVVAVVSLFAASNAAPQSVVTQRILSLTAARTIAEAALAECTSRGFHTSVAVVDRSGNLLVVLRHELAHPVTVDMARSKAYTAVVFRSSTMDLQRDTANDPARLPSVTCPDSGARRRRAALFGRGNHWRGCELGLEPAKRRRVREGRCSKGREPTRIGPNSEGTICESSQPLAPSLSPSSWRRRVRASFVRGAVRRLETDHAARHGDESRVAQPPHLGLFGREERRWLGNAWQCEGGAPKALTRQGWSRQDLESGEPLTIVGYLAKDGSKTCNARTWKVGDRSVLAGPTTAVQRQADSLIFKERGR